MPLYLGLDCSTQSLTAIVIRADDEHREVAFTHALAFDEAFPEYGTRHGVLPSADPRVQVSAPALWAAALERMMGIVASSGIDVSDVAAISGSAQQHGSVYLQAQGVERLPALDPSRPLAGQLAGAWSRAVAPVWMDTSTREECTEITASLGGPERVAEHTGSRVFERFTGPQIRRFFKTDPLAYGKTARIHLVSSFLASLLAGADAPLDPGDGSGMNLMDLERAAWWPEALEATAPGLARRLPAIRPSATVVGTLAPYWRKRHGWPASAVVAWSGDNPCSLIGTGLVDESRIAVSLGTSDTVFGPMREARVDAGGRGHVFGAPTGEFMGLTCFRNGSLARERIRDEHGYDWDGFSRALRSTPPGNLGRMMTPWFEPEITPDVPAPAVRRLGLDPADGPANVRAIVEAQMMAMANHSAWMGGVKVEAIHATGGASVNRDVLQVMADVFGADVYQFQVENAACLGAALRAWHAHEASCGRPRPWTDIVRGLAEPVLESRVSPDAGAVAVYAALRARYADFARP